MIIPPIELMHDGPPDVETFIANGLEYLGIYQSLCNLQPHEDMLDVGCGIGRKTLPLTDYLSPTARYEGFDVNKTGIEWCRENIQARFKNFRFSWFDVYHALYNPTGKRDAACWAFPYEDNSFDFVAANSVFTHIPADVTRNYLSEIARVLKPRGRCLISWFLMDNLDDHLPTEVLGRVGVNDTVFAYSTPWVRTQYRQAGLIRVGTEYGTWAGKQGSTYQDLILAYN